MQQMLILVDENDNQIGVEEKIKAHQQALLHRAFSILIYNKKGEMLLQQRALGKYHAGGLWTNACCGHPNPGETVEHAVHRRIQEEMGFDCELTPLTHMVYKLPISNGLTEHEYLHRYNGIYDGEIVPNPEEAMSHRWITKENLEKETREKPETFTPWFLLALQKFPFGK
ncbi:MAG: isopentenyl-diphosphate delta-isomerase [Candidatus Andersenbacteria bacterium RIFCSPHIGHO2_02_FULL_45_11]|nr:MAG: isopentenyl-diphosphate delta-isomerase [Candidatus Andersenbacteria bacterium RIFCSPHIGHO2_01_FULL_46_36]OGY32690.1 MAG: isopentenyl-diphosphate delta-isomerase [Candidatus Andersenbacteria bacterium RIFCSPHIGHO2_02_FULL_45_11]